MFSMKIYYFLKVLKARRGAITCTVGLNSIINPVRRIASSSVALNYANKTSSAFKFKNEIEESTAFIFSPQTALDKSSTSIIGRLEEWITNC